jgi:GT2 family glycosyltransferase
MPPDLTVSIISADNLKLLIPCLASIYENTHHISLEVFVVDNASTSEPLIDTVMEEFPQVHVIKNNQRLGFSTNNNQVFRQGTGRYLMLLNDDTLVLPEALDRIVEFMDENLLVGATGGYLLNPDGTFQSAFAHFPHPVTEAVRPALNWSKPIHSLNPVEVDSVHGAAMAIRRDASDQVGLLDPAYDPIYSEEVDWCYRIKRAGWKIYTLPSAQVIHYGSVTMNRAVPRRYELLLSHKVLFFRKNIGGLAANIYRILLIGSTSIKVVIWSARNLLHPNELAREKRDLHRYILTRISFW